jgi:predicted Zn-ribbon and HTH transcriptional regulator
MPKVMISGFECSRCTHQWVPRNKGEKPTVCPKCKNPYWDKPKRKGMNKGDKS